MIDRALIRPMSRRTVTLGRGFVATYLRGANGDHHVIRRTKALQHDQLAHRALLVKGGLRLVEAPAGAEAWPDINVGSPTYVVHAVSVPGVYIRECQGDTIILCLNRGGRGFNYSFINARAGEEISVPLGGVLLTGECELLHGAATIQSSDGEFRPILAETKQISLTATAPVRGLMGWVP